MATVKVKVEVTKIEFRDPQNKKKYEGKQVIAYLWDKDLSSGNGAEWNGDFPAALGRIWLKVDGQAAFLSKKTVPKKSASSTTDCDKTNQNFPDGQPRIWYTVTVK